MHELGIAREIVELATAAARRAGAERVTCVRVRIGALAGVVEEALQFAFESAAAGTAAESARLEVEAVPVRCYCRTCGFEFETEPLAYECPRCGKGATEIRAGREMELVSIEVT